MRAMLLFLTTGLMILFQFTSPMVNALPPETYESMEGDPFHIRIYTLGNGLKVYLSQNKRAPRVQLFIAVKAGSADEKNDSQGVAHYFEHMMFKGNSKIASLNWEKEKPLLDQIAGLFEKHRMTKDPQERRALYQEIDRLSAEAAQYSNNEYWDFYASMGGTGLNAWTGFDETVYLADVPVNQLEKVLMLESERFREIALRRFHTELETVYEEYNRMQDKESTITYYALLKQLYGEHPYGRYVIGNADHIKAPSMNDVYEFFRTYYRPDNMAVILVGDLDYDKTIAMVDRFFGGLTNGPKGSMPSGRTTKVSPITGVKEITVAGPEKEAVYLGFRFPENEENDLMLFVIDQILSNGTAGLLDTDLVKRQKVQTAAVWTMPLRDYQTVIFYAEPLKGQTHDELKGLLLGEIEKIKKGEFEPWVIKAIADHDRLGLIHAAEKRDHAAQFMKDLFIENRSIESAIKKADRLDQITPKEIMEFAARNFQQNYVYLKKTIGNVEKHHAEKPPITPVSISKEKSKFSTQFYDMKPGPDAEPLYLDFKRDFSPVPLKNGLPLYSLQNKENERFTLHYQFPVGTRNDKELELALSYASVLGTDRYAPGELSKEFYRYALDFRIISGTEDSFLVISGLQRNFEKALELMEHVIHHLKPDDKAYDSFVRRVMKARENARKNPDVILSAMRDYAFYGPNNPSTDRLSEAQMRSLKPSDLVKRIDSITNREHLIFYYGPMGKDVLMKALDQSHATVEASQRRAFPDYTVYPIVKQDGNLLYLFDYPMAQTKSELYRLVPSGFSMDKLAFATMSYPYGGTITSDELREKQAFAYTAYTYFGLPDNLSDPALFGGAIGTQPDKLPDALRQMLCLLDRVPSEKIKFELAKERVIQTLRPSRISGEDAFAHFLRAKKRNLDHDWRKDIYDSVANYTLEHYNADQTRFGKEESGSETSPVRILVIGDRKLIKDESLQSLGTIRHLKAKDLFGE